MKKNVVFVLISLLVGIGLLQTGCRLRDNNPEGAITSDLGQVEGKTANVQFRFEVPGALKQSLGAVLPAITDVQVSVALQLVNVGNQVTPANTFTKTANSDLNGVASVTFQDLPLKPALAKVTIIGGNMGGATAFRGAIDLAAGNNTITLASTTSKTRTDVVAQVIENLIASPSLMASAPSALVARVASIVDSLTLTSPTIYTDATNQAAQAFSSSGSSTYTFTTLAGQAGTLLKSIDGTGTAAQFYQPRGIAVDSSGNLYVADSSNHSIRKITSVGVVTTLAGTAGLQGYTDGTGAAARFNEPFAIVVDNSTGNLFVADTSNNAIRKITPAGVVTTFAGGGAAGSTDGTGTAARLNEPRGLAIDSSGSLYVADYDNHIIRRITSAGVVTTLAGVAGSQGSTDGTGTAARFMGPCGIGVDGSGNAFVADTGNRTIRKITPAGVVTTFAGTAGTSGLTDGTGTAARFSAPRGITVDAAGTLYVTDYNGFTLRKITSAGVVTTLAGMAVSPGSTDGTGTAARFYYPSGVAVDSAGTVYVADTSNSTIRKVTSAGVVTTFAGLAGRSSSVDGTGTAARFEDPYSIAADGAGNIYVADATDHSIRKVTSGGVVTTIAGTAGSFGSADGTGTAARFFGPQGIAADSSGNLYVSDTGNNTIRKITSAGVVTTLAGTAGQGGNTDGTGAAARFSGPSGIAIDNAGNLYIVDGTSNTIRKLTSAGVVTTLAGTVNTPGFIDGTGTAARFTAPFDLAVDPDGTNVYVCDHGNHAIRKIVTATGVVSTLAGTGSMGSTNGTGTAASFRFPSGIAVDSTGNVYVADTDNQIIRKITSTGVVTTAGGSGVVGSADGSGSSATFYNPKDVAVDSSGNLYIADRNNHTIRKGAR